MRKVANADITKDALARALKRLLEEQRLEKISVKDITDQCGISRNTFYYHFQDKYELMNWIFENDLSSHDIVFNDSSKFLSDSYKRICKILLRERDFYLSCFRYGGQNSLSEALGNLYQRLWKERLQKRYQDMRMEIDDEELTLMAKMNTRAVVGMIEDWIRGGMLEDYMGYYEKNLSVLDNKECFVVRGKYIMFS